MPKGKQTKRGGGSWDEYCYCCGLPFSYDFDPETYISENNTNKTNQRTILAEKNMEVETSIAWLHTSIGLDSFHDMIFELGRGSDMGEMRMKPQHTYPGAQELYAISNKLFTTGEGVNGMNEENLRGLAIHKDCVHVLEKAIGRPLKPSDETLLRRFQQPSEEGRNDGACFTKYNQQMYNWAEALLHEPVSFFASPRTDEAQRHRVLSCNSEFIAVAKATRNTKNTNGGTRRTMRKKQRRNRTRRMRI